LPYSIADVHGCYPDGLKTDFWSLISGLWIQLRATGRCVRYSFAKILSSQPLVNAQRRVKVR
jgi:hypothetical protein